MKYLFVILLMTSLSGCGAALPDLVESPHSNYDTGQFVNKVATHVRCELRDAILVAYRDRDAQFLHEWSAKITMSIFADEKTNLTPSLGVTGAFASSALRSVAFGLAGVYDREATRKVEVTWFEVFDDLTSGDNLRRRCGVPGGEGISGDLRIAETLDTAVVPAGIDGSFYNGFKDKAGPLQSVQNTITFQVDVGGSATPSFTLTNVVVNPGSPFASANRERQDQLLITMGPGQIEGAKRPFERRSVRASPEVIGAHDSGRFGLELQNYLQGRAYR